MCLFPKLILNKKFRANKKNGGNVPPIKDIRTLYVPVGCGKCMECMKKKAREWQIRLTEEIKENKNGQFITLTFSEESLNELRIETETGEDNEVATLGVRRFLERWRKKYKKSVRHWLVTELGHENTERIHLHGILFTDQTKEEIETIWAYGYIYKGLYVNERTINYIVKYIHKTDKDHVNYQPKILATAGIGSNYNKDINKQRHKYKENETKETYKFRNGRESSLPIYYRNKMITEQERENLWIEKINKKERWVCGEKVSGKRKDIEQYHKLREYYVEKNRRLGYGGDEKFNRETYDDKIKNLE